jgi:uncharacterized protein
MRAFISSLVAIALAACGSSAPAQPAKPAMWKLYDHDTTIYLFGTVHVLPKDLKWRTPRFDEAANEAGELVLEIADNDDAAGVAQTYARLATSPGLPPVLDRVPADKREKFAVLIAKAGLKPEQLNALETWAVAIQIGAAMYRSIGASPSEGVETTLRAGVGDKKVTALETTEQQLGYFDTMPEAVQRKLLVSMIDDADSAAADFEAMLKAWSTGDVDAIARTFDDELRTAPEIAEVLIDRRNQAWVEWLKRRLDQPGTALVAVGAGHLAGKGSVIDLLEREKLKVERVQ